ncbi:MAG: SDR family oxidoreductase [Chitinophagaceae bacterium]|nr:SDR family oxidoreductase [Chitinophagaceae bacterium]MCW5925913.1 SDR family oxidoreductase [Chitinophagaceae bacterium]
MKLEKEVAIVTGAGQGIGYEIARQLCANGAAVVLNDIDAELSQKAAAALRAEGYSCAAFDGDVSQVASIEQMVQFAVKQFGKLTISIANAGITLFGDFLSYPPESLTKVMQVNLSGSFFLAQLTAREIIRQQSGGSILFMSSVTGHQAHKNLAAYGMTKAALEMLAKNLVVELSGHNISVNAIAPGATLTERTTNDPEYINTWSRITPMGRPATVSDIANAAIFFVSPASRHITGQSLVIDGGWTSVSPSPY